MKQFLALPKGNLLSIFALIWVALIQPVFADEPARISPDKLSLQNAVELARQKNPSLLLSAKNHKAAIAQIGASRSAFYPQLEADLTYTRATANFAPQPGLSLPGGGGSETDVSYPNYNGILTVHQLLYDFGKVNTQVRSAERLAESSEADRKSTDAVIVLNVKQAYYGL